MRWAGHVARRWDEMITQWTLFGKKLEEERILKAVNVYGG
jgi:hypothetical protein